jgi:hypothetical protein
MTQILKVDFSYGSILNSGGVLYSIQEVYLSPAIKTDRKSIPIYSNYVKKIKHE